MIEVTSKKDLESQLLKEKKVLALFYASWCPFCTRFLPVFKRASSESKFAVFLMVRIDDYNNPLWEDYDIEAVPTAILLVEGKVQRRLDADLGGGLRISEFNEWLEKVETDCNKLV